MRFVDVGDTDAFDARITADELAAAVARAFDVPLAVSVRDAAKRHACRLVDRFVRGRCWRVRPRSKS